MALITFEEFSEDENSEIFIRARKEYDRYGDDDQSFEDWFNASIVWISSLYANNS